MLIIISIMIFYLLCVEQKLENRINSNYINVISKNPLILYSILFNYNTDKTNIINRLTNKYKCTPEELVLKFNMQDNNLIDENLINSYISNVILLQYTKQYNINLETMMTDELCNDLVKHVKYCSKLEGDFVDVGVWHGGSSMLMQNYNRNNKNVYLLDLFDHMNEQSINNDDTTKDKMTIEFLNLISDYFNEPTVITNENVVKDNFTKNNVSLKNCHFIKGNLNDKNFPYDKINKISLLRIDCDFYSATKSVLINLYPKMTKGCIIIFDDFNIPCLGEKDAALEYFKDKNIDVKFYSVGQSAYMIV